MTQPDWFLLVHDWVIKRRMTGLSLPFLVGVRAMKGGRDGTVEDAKQILKEIADKPIEGYLAELRWCNFLRTYVVGIRKVNDEPMLGKVYSSALNGTASMVVHQDLSRKWGDDLSTIFDGIANEARIPIESRLYSRSPASGEMKWEPFSRSDHERINQALGASPEKA